MKLSPNKIHNSPKTLKNALVFGLIWQVIWIFILAEFDIREKLIAAGLFGPNCGSCEEQTTWSTLGIMIPLIIGAGLISFATSNVIGIKNRFLKWLLPISLTILISYASFWVFSILGFALHYGK